MYEYIIGDVILGIIWTPLFILRKDLRKVMIWGGLTYIAILTIGFFLFELVLLFYPVAEWRTVIPGYWNPKTVFDLGKFTGGYAIEDAIFMFWVGGIATASYEFLTQKKIKPVKAHSHHRKALLIGLLAGFLSIALLEINMIYALIVFGFVGTATIWLQRHDLIGHSLISGLIFAGIYFVAYLSFIVLFPGFIERTYNIENVSGILIYGMPLEELLYALSFGALWGPFYEYEHGTKDV